MAWPEAFYDIRFWAALLVASWIVWKFYLSDYDETTGEWRS